MLPVEGHVLATNASGAADGAQVTLHGGRYVLTIVAGTFPSTCALQILASDNATWVSINGSAFAANALNAYDLPAGQCRLHMSGGTVAAVYATLVRIGY